MAHKTHSLTKAFIMCMLAALFIAGCDGQTPGPPDRPAEEEMTEEQEAMAEEEMVTEEPATEEPAEEGEPSIQQIVEGAQRALANALDGKVLNPDNAIVYEGAVVAPLLGEASDDDVTAIENGDLVVVAAAVIMEETNFLGDLPVDTTVAIACNTEPICVALNSIDGENVFETGDVSIEDISFVTDPELEIGSLCVSWDSRRWCIG